MHGSKYVTKKPTGEECWLQSYLVHPHDEDQEAPWSQNSQGKDAVASRENMMNWDKMSPVTIYMHNHFLSLEMALKIIFIYVQGCEKRNPTQILKDMHVIRSGKPEFIILDRYSFC